MSEAARFLQQFRASVRDLTTELSLKFPQEEMTTLRAEALLLLSRLLFLAFVEERGWLAGDRRYLRRRLEDDLKAGREYFASTLRPLFFGCLNVPEEERGGAHRLGPIPYLNSGLFQPSPFEERHPDLRLPNSLLRHIVLQAFGAFVFQLEPEANETTIDPEMLGRVFESLMEREDRSSSGSFYTPKPIANALAGHAIAAWLESKREHDALAHITVLDPACGSGAFLLAALSAIVRRQKLLGQTPDIRKIVAHSLYGVDRNPDAVRLCELRLWLSIAAAHREGDSIAVLPNLDRNILPGDSLLAPTDFLGDAKVEVFRAALGSLRQQRALLERYRFAAYSERPALYRAIHENDVRVAGALLRQCISEREALLREAAGAASAASRYDVRRAREVYEELEEERALLGRIEEGTLDFFSYNVQFGPVMAAGGFDVVLGNPPWVRSAAIDGCSRRVLRAHYRLFHGERGEPMAFGQADLAIAFFERAMALTAPGGILAMLMSSKIATAAYAAPLRRALQGRVLSVIDWRADARFDAHVYPVGIVLRPHATSPSIRLVQDGAASEIPALALRAEPGSEWAIVPPLVLPVLRRLYADYSPLEVALGRRPRMGVKTGDNARFFLDGREITGWTLVTSDGVKVPLRSVCVCVRGRDLRRWSMSRSVWMLWVSREERQSPPPWLQALADARGIAPEEFRIASGCMDRGEIVAWKDISRGVAAAVLPTSVQVERKHVAVVPNQTLYSLSARSSYEAHAIAAVLNSTVAGALLVGDETLDEGRVDAVDPDIAEVRNEVNGKDGVVCAQSRRLELRAAEIVCFPALDEVAERERTLGWSEPLVDFSQSPAEKFLRVGRRRSDALPSRPACEGVTRLFSRAKRR